MEYLRRNNFDLIRLVAASQVMLFHGIEHLDAEVGHLRFVLAQFPGVPAFFLISGFLISASWERNPDLRIYAVNRALRVFPALWATVVGSVLSLFLFYEPSILYTRLPQLLAWMIGQGSIFQQWNPDFLRSYGVGVMNGSLWTISVELCFYVLTPILYLAAPRKDRFTRALWIILALSFFAQYAVKLRPISAGFPIVYDLIGLSFIPWVGMFLFGVAAQRSIEKIYPIVAGRAPVFFIIFALASLLALQWPFYPILKGTSNSIGIVNYIAMSGLILSCAFTYPNLSERILRRNDISYGVYIIHMPVINALVHFGWLGIPALLASIGITVILASISWRAIEKPALRLKPRSLYKHT